jgi:hypothetical protein
MFPINMQIGVGLGVLVDWDEAGTGSEYPVTVTVSDEGGVPVFPPWQVQFQVGKPDGMPRGSSIVYRLLSMRYFRFHGKADTSLPLPPVRRQRRLPFTPFSLAKKFPSLLLLHLQNEGINRCVKQPHAVVKRPPV